MLEPGLLGRGEVGRKAIPAGQRGEAGCTFPPFEITALVQKQVDKGIWDFSAPNLTLVPDQPDAFDARSAARILNVNLVELNT